ncbi:MAG: A/G-specific adenine glycosylase [Lachnospiraceae bacterium]
MRLDSEIVAALLNWYDYNARVLPWREDKNPYRIWVSEIMLQQTRVEAVKPYYYRFMEALPAVADLACVSEEQLMKLWEGLGYYNRARNLQKAAQIIMQQYHGEMPHDYETLLKLPGIGEYTAGAIASIAFGQPVTAVDGNVLRIIMRLQGCYDDVLKQSTKRMVSDALQEVLPVERVSDFNQALMELGALVCIPNGKPHCEECPWDTRCMAFQKELTGEIPVKKAKKARRIESKTVLLLQYCQEILLHKRGADGLLANLWEFPNLEGKLEKRQVEQWLEEQNITDYVITSLDGGKHVFSHVEWHMTGFRVCFQTQPTDWTMLQEDTYRWVVPEELAENVAIPAAFETFKQQIE